jgi:hypothetical protein
MVTFCNTVPVIVDAFYVASASRTGEYVSIRTKVIVPIVIFDNNVADPF